MNKCGETMLGPVKLVKVVSLWQFFLWLSLLAITLPACAAQRGSMHQAEGVLTREAKKVEGHTRYPANPGSPAKAPDNSADANSYSSIAPVWRPLAMRLAKDGTSGQKVTALLETLPATHSQSPMGRKMKALYRRQFLPRPKTAKAEEKYYKGVVTLTNAQICGQFIREHEAYFRMAWEKYGVQPQIAAALLFVETRLGKVLGDVPENAFYTLASMAISDKPDDISQWLSSMPGYHKHLPWMLETMRKRSDWAYRETRALIEHMIVDNIPPERLPGSIYGAVGLCQFMPSNISAYGADGDGDGRVDLFTVPDAVASLSNYLARHGWKPGLSLKGRHKVLMTYNHSTVYANTILALSALMEEKPATQKKRGGEK